MARSAWAWIRGLAGWRRAAFAFAAGRLLGTRLRAGGFFSRLAAGLCRSGVAAGRRRPEPASLSQRRDHRAGPFAFGQYLVGWHWIGYAFLVDPAAHLWQTAVRAAVSHRRAWRFIAGAGLRRWRFISGRTARRGFWFSPCAMAPANGCAAMSSPAFPGICRPMAGALPWPLLQSASPDGRLWAFLPDHSFGRFAGRILAAAPLATAPRAADAASVCGALGFWRLAAGRRTRRNMCRTCSCGWCSPTFRRREKYLRRLCAAQLAAADGSQSRLPGPGPPTSSGRKRRRLSRLPRSAGALDADRAC